MTNKHKALQTWVQNFLADNYLYFQTADAAPGIRTIVPNYGDFLAGTDIQGNKYKEYSFVFIGYEQIDPGTSDVNTDNIQVFDNFNDWIVEQETNKNFPDFGSNCSDYEIEPLQNMANLADIDENGLAKYMLGVKIKYVEGE